MPLKEKLDFIKTNSPASIPSISGGGSPSILSEEQLGLASGDLIFDRFHFDPDTEITIEANPNDLDPAKLKTLRELGVNRLSLGVQSFDDQELLFLRRRHTVKQAGTGLEMD